MVWRNMLIPSNNGFYLEKLCTNAPLVLVRIDFERGFERKKLPSLEVIYKL